MNSPIGRSLGAAVVLVAAAAFVAGCPVYSTYANYEPRCVYATDCSLGYRCNYDGYCVPGPGFSIPPATNSDGGSVEGGISDTGATDGLPEARSSDAGPGDAPLESRIPDGSSLDADAAD
jgi:hypothetical protein